MGNLIDSIVRGRTRAPDANRVKHVYRSQTDYKYSSIVFFHIRSADSKVKLVDRLCHAHFDKTIIKKEWTPLLKDLNSAVEIRNSIAHWDQTLFSTLVFWSLGSRQ